jgi:hypothetical protein
VERSIKTIKQTVFRLIHGTSVYWPLYIPFAQLAYNNKVQELTGATPFSLMFGRKMNEMRDYTAEPHQPVDLDGWKAHQDKVVSLIFPAINERVRGKQAESRERVDKWRKQIVKEELLPGTVVLIKDPLYLLNPSTRPSTEPTYIGPYTVVRRTKYGPYILRDDTGAIYSRQVPVDQMKVVYSHSTVAGGGESDDSDVYEVDYIADHKEEGGEFRYLVKWKGYDRKEATWEPEENINDPQPIERYFKLLMAKDNAKKGTAGSASMSVVLTARNVRAWLDENGAGTKHPSLL